MALSTGDAPIMINLTKKIPIWIEKYPIRISQICVYEQQNKLEQECMYFVSGSPPNHKGNFERVLPIFIHALQHNTLL